MPSLPAAVAETHISVLVFVGERVYKLKKPVSMGFLDFSAREAREMACHREVELNRRLAPDVYLGVADITGPEGVLCDHLVVMRRMPGDRRLAALVRDGTNVTEELRRIARRVATFHAAAPTSPEIAEAGSLPTVLGHWEANFEELRPFVGPVLDAEACARVEELVRQYLAGRTRLLGDRVEAGCIRDGHGDLQAEDIFCLADGPRILDCIEFDDRLRYGDVLADVAFLAMDLERLGAPVGAERFLAYYREFAGETYPSSLAHHYIAYRAHVRAKVACLRHEQGDGAAAGAARHLLGLCLAHLEQGQVSLVLVGGLPGTGKSTLAAGLGDRLGWALLRSDEMRKDLAGMPRDQYSPAPYGEGLYQPHITDEVYRTLLERAREALELGEPVILDASWSDAKWRAAAAEVARATSSDVVEFRCEAPRDLAATRIRDRAERGSDPSDATPEVAAAMAAAADPWPTAGPIDTSGQPEEALEQALHMLATRT
jgi:uncharacterized protein